MAELIKNDGTIEKVTPKSGKSFTVEEMQGFVEGYFQPIYLTDGRIMLVNEDGLLLEHIRNRRNEEATKIVVEFGRVAVHESGIVGNVLILTHKEMG